MIDSSFFSSFLSHTLSIGYVEPLNSSALRLTKSAGARPGSSSVVSSSGVGWSAAHFFSNIVILRLLVDFLAVIDSAHALL